ncbi:MAG: septal ring lytic transglycosylase RlpA family protein [Terriglobales bacterium]
MPPGVTWGAAPTATPSAPPPPVAAPPPPALRLALLAGAPELVQPPRDGEVWQIGIASFYGLHEQGHETADGERFNYHAMTAASRTLPFGTRVRVTDLATDRSVVVRINDRGPFWTHRILDLSAGAARRIGLYRQGLGRVRVEIVQLPRPLPPGRYTVQVGWFHHARRWRRCRQLMRQAVPDPVIGFRSSYGRWLRYGKDAALSQTEALRITARLRAQGYPAYIVRLN